MTEIKGKLETTFCWTCEACTQDNAVLDNQRCIKCGKEIGDEKVLRHFKLIPEPIRLGFRT